jgi:hypothetical protein
MDEPAERTSRPQPVQRFKPTSGHLVGYVGIALCAFALGYVVLFVHSVTGLRIGLGAVFFGVLVWVTQVRPRATAYPQHVVLKNSVRDAHVPLARVDEVAIGQMLSLWVGEDRYVCIGIGNTLREDFKARRRSMVEDAELGTSRYSELRRKADLANLDERAMSYQTFVVTRLEELVEEAKREQARLGSEPPHPHHELAWPELVVLAVTGLAFVVSLLL